MKKQKQSARGRYISADKFLRVLSNLGAEITSGKQRIRVGKVDNSIIIYANGGTVNITFNEEGGNV